MPCTSISSRVPARGVQPVDVLGDHRVEQPGPLELGQRLVRAVGLLVLQRLEAAAVEVPEALGVAPEDVDVGDLHRVDVLPQAGARRAEVRDPGRHRDPRPGQRHDRAAPRISSASVGRGVVGADAHLPWNRGVALLPRKAEIPSRASSEPNTRRERLLLGVDARRRDRRRPTPA